jgi:hypothetical protein
MSTEESELPHHDRAETARALARLKEGLGASSALTDIADLTVEQLAAWKPRIERTAFEDPQRAEELARLMMTVAEATAAADRLALATSAFCSIGPWKRWLRLPRPRGCIRRVAKRCQ